ncbi:MAG: hypothetical protein U1E53_15850 [Dongiaceae bacterium]
MTDIKFSQGAAGLFNNLMDSVKQAVEHVENLQTDQARARADARAKDGVQHAGGDNYVVDGQPMSLATLIMLVNMQRAELMDKQMGDQLAAMKERNDQTRQLNDLLNKLRQARPKDGAEGTVPTLSPEDRALCKTLGIDIKSGEKMKAADYDAKVIEQIKTGLDNLNNTSQMDMLRFQKLSENRDNIIKLISNYIDKNAKVLEDIFRK